MSNDGTTHHAQCYRYHHDCAVRELERLRRIVGSWYLGEDADLLRAELKRLEALGIVVKWPDE